MFNYANPLMNLNVSCYYLIDMRRDVQEVFRMTPHEKQVMMFSATLPKDIRPVCKKFMQDVNIFPNYNIAVAAPTVHLMTSASWLNWDVACRVDARIL